MGLPESISHEKVPPQLLCIICTVLALLDSLEPTSYSKKCLVGRPWRVPATRPDPNFFLLPEPDPNYFSKFPSLGFFPVSCFPVGCFKSFNNGPQILLFSSRPDMKSSVSKSKCLDRRNGSKESQKNWTIDLWYILIYSSRRPGNQSFNQKGNNLVSEAHALSNLKLHLTTTRSSSFSGFNLALLGVTRSDLDEAAGTGKTTLTSLSRKNWH